MALRRSLGGKIILLCLLGAVTAGYVLYDAIIKTWFVEQSQDLGFVLNSLEITGIHKTQRADIYRVMDMDLGTPVLSIDVQSLQERVASLPWVKTVKISRKLPDGLDIHIQEREAFALWQLDGRLHLIDTEGQKIDNIVLTDYADLRVFVGAGAEKQALKFQETISRFPDLDAVIQSAIWVGDRRWDIIFESGVRLKLPEESHKQPLATMLLKFKDLNAEHHILSRDITVVDLRFDDRLIMRVSPDARPYVTNDYEKI